LILRAISIGLIGAGLVGLAACTTVASNPATVANCRPATQIYQPGVMGGAGSVINLPGNCPSPSQVARTDAATAATAATATARPDTRPVPPPLPDARTAITKGVDELCAWFLRGEGYSLDALHQVAFSAGFRRGAQSDIIFSEGALDDGSASALSMQAVIAGAPQGSIVPAFVTFDPPQCQLQVYGFHDEAERYFAGLPGRGWTRAGTPVQSSANVRTERWLGGPTNNRVTMFINRWSGENAAPDGLWQIINILGGEVQSGGELK